MITTEQIQQLLNAQENNDFVTMLQIAETLLKIAPQNDFLLHSKAIALCRLNQIEKSIEVFKQAIDISPDNPKILLDFANVLLNNSTKKSNWLIAENILLKLYNKSKNNTNLSAKNDSNINAEILSLLSLTYANLENFDNAEIFAKELISRYPKSEGHFRLAKLFAKKNLQILALAEFQKAVKIQPTNFAAFDGLVSVLKNIGEADLAYQLLQNYLTNLSANCKSATQILPYFMRNLAVAPYFSRVNTNLIKQHYSQFCEIVTQAYPQKFFHEKSKNFYKNLVEKNPNQSQKLRIGFVSGDFNNHAVSKFLLNFLEKLQTASVDIFLYSNDDSYDAITEQLKNLCKKYQNICHLEDQIAAETIVNDNIQILFDLSGHTAKHRLFMFALKPAPIQISWIGWLGTTGIPTMDYFLADEFCVPFGEKHEQQFYEKVLRMPNIWEVLTPPDFPREIRKNFWKFRGNFTFGSFNNPNKVNSKTLDLWCEVLKKSPENTEFIWLRGDFVEKDLQEKFLAEFSKRGANKNQILLKNYENYQNYLQTILGVDLILDSVQFSGMTTTAEALSLGTPTITLLGDLMPSRLSGSCINAIGDANLNKNFIFDSENDFVNQAVFFANNKDKLNELKIGLAEKARKSPLCDAELFAKNFEIKMWEIWNNFLEN